MIKTLNLSGTKGNFLNLIKASTEKLIVNITLSGERLVHSH